MHPVLFYLTKCSAVPESFSAAKLVVSELWEKVWPWPSGGVVGNVPSPSTLHTAGHWVKGPRPDSHSSFTTCAAREVRRHKDTRSPDIRGIPTPGATPLGGFPDEDLVRFIKQGDHGATGPFGACPSQCPWGGTLLGRYHRSPSEQQMKLWSAGRAFPPHGVIIHQSNWVVI